MKDPSLTEQQFQCGVAVSVYQNPGVNSRLISCALSITHYEQRTLFRG